MIHGILSKQSLSSLFQQFIFSCSTLIRLLLWCTLWSKHATCANYSGKNLSIFDSCEESYVANDRNCCFNITQIFLTAKRDFVYRKFNPTMSASFLNNPLLRFSQKNAAAYSNNSLWTPYVCMYRESGMLLHFVFHCIEIRHAKKDFGSLTYIRILVKWEPIPRSYFWNVCGVICQSFISAWMI